MSEPIDKFDHKEIDAKWQKRWREAELFKVTEDATGPKSYVLDMFPYPSGAGISVGHCRNYIPSDCYARFMRMRGNNVLHPMGWDAFGQPAETEAIKRGSHPRETVPKYVANYKRQLNLVGISFDWSREFNSSEPDYYKWTQWIFLLLYKRGLAYRSMAPANWCPQEKTVLANEEVQGGLCWRCGSRVEKRDLPQWFLKITDYAERLLHDLDGLEWSEGLKMMQRNWIGRSEGVEFEMKVDGTEHSFRVFTTRIDTVFGMTFCVFAPEHPLVVRITTDERRAEVEVYAKRAQALSEIDRMATEREKSGVFTGAYAINPANGARVPIWVADYVLMGYGTGAIMAVPGHDERDFEFAKKYGLEIRRVIADNSSLADVPLEKAEPAYGVMVNAGEYSGVACDEGQRRLGEWFEAQRTGERKVNYRLRDWLISRQRYWGCPIPMIHCPSCGMVPVPDTDLPVLLPDVDNYQPTGTGESPLAAIPEFINVNCPSCGGAARRETDTMAGSACSSWYFLRYADPKNDQAAFDPAKAAYWLPVDCYVGGTEHAVGHLLYARFWTKVLQDAGYITFGEPFLKLMNQGSVLGLTPFRKPRENETLSVGQEGILVRPEDVPSIPQDQVFWRWERMSKSKGNVVTPDEMVEDFGADSLRIYELFVAPFEMNIQWSSEGMQGANRFLNRVWRAVLGAKFDREWRSKLEQPFDGKAKSLRQKTHSSLAKVYEDISGFRFNTAVAAMMEWLNELQDFQSSGGSSAAESEAIECFVRALSPMAPHLADEMWERLGFSGFLLGDRLIDPDPAVAKADTVTIAVQVNGKLRSTLEVPAETVGPELERLALADQKVVQHTDGLTVRKVIVVPGRLVNIVAS